MADAPNVNGQKLLPGSSDVAGAMSTRNAGLDKETRLMMICYSMLNVLDQRMSEQMDVMQERNKRATELKGVIADMNALAAKYKSGAGNDDVIKLEDLSANDQVVMKTLVDTLKAAGIPGLENLIKGGEGKEKVRKGDLDAAISKVTGMMDSDATIQQLEMFTLQSVFSKRNEIFELMSNAMKKCQDTKSTLVRNF